MRKYDSSAPIVFNHIPKCAGSTVSLYFKKHLFRNNFKPYYFFNALRTPKFPNPQEIGCNSIITSHFNYKSNPIEQTINAGYKQFYTIFRDPFELVVSLYFYQRSRKNFIDWPLRNKLKMITKFGFSSELFRAVKLVKESPANQLSLDEFLLTKKEIILQYLPRGITSENFEDYFEKNYICLGITDRINDSLQLFAKKINKKFNKNDVTLKNITKGKKFKPSSIIKEKFLNQNKVSYLIYNYALRRFNEEYSKEFNHR